MNQTSAFVAGGVVPFRMGNSHPSLFPYEPLPCADGELIITAGNDGQFRRLCEVLGLPELVDDPRFRRNEDRTANRDELRPLLVERLRTRSKMDWFRDIIGAGVPVRADQHHRPGRRPSPRRSAWTRWSTVGEGAAAVPSVRNPITFSDHRGGLPAAAAHARRARRRDPPLAGRAGRRGALGVSRRTSRSRPRSAPRPPTRSGCSART